MQLGKKLLWSDRQFAFTLAVSLLIVVLHFWLHPVRVLDMDTSIFYLDEKYTLATWWSVALATLTVQTIWRTLPKSPRDRIVKLALGTFFIALAFDEFFEVHEYANTLIKRMISDDAGLLRLSFTSWIFPLALFILIVIGLFVLALSRAKSGKVRWLYALGIATYVSVLGLELAGSVTFGQDIYLVFVGLEEGLEMIGTALFLYAVSAEAEYLSLNT